MLIVFALIGCVFYSFFVWLIVEKLETAMLSTLVGHEINEVVGDLDSDPDAILPNTASLQAFLLSRDDSVPVPRHLKELPPDLYSTVTVGPKKYHVAVIDHGAERIYLSFDITHLDRYGRILLFLLVGGGLLTAVLLIAVSIWFSRRFLLPVSTLAEQVAGIDPNQRNVRIEENYRGYEVGLIAQSIDQFLDRMDDFVEREQSFTSAVSHELRTPVSVISTATELLELDPGNRANNAGTIKRIKQSTEHMQETIESLLYFARDAGGGKPANIAQVSASAVVEKVLKDYADQAAAKQLSLQADLPADTRVRIPFNHLSMVVSNLVQNALQYTEQGEVRISLDVNGLRVSDTGRGIESDELDLICKRCHRSPDSPGCGLGLHLVMSICAYYDLELAIDSVVGKGSVFTVTFPTASA